MTKRLLLALTALALGMLQAPLAAAPAPPRPLCFGEPATIFLPGTESSATSVEGTDGDDVIVTGAGQDAVDGGRGDDLICTRGGRDTIRGGRGFDRMRGGPGTDTLRGQRGLDSANGGRGDNDACAAERRHRCETRLT